MTNCKHFNNNQCEYININIPCTFHNNENVTNYNELAQEFCKFYQKVEDPNKFYDIEIMSVQNYTNLQFDTKYQVKFACRGDFIGHHWFTILCKDLKFISLKYKTAIRIDNMITLSNDDESIIGIQVKGEI